MAESAIITGQYVRLQPTVASVGDRILAQILDWIVLFAYVMLAIIIAADIIKTEWYYIITIGVIPLFYTLLMEIFNQGQSVGKMIMNMQVVKLDGSRPTMSAYLMRWLLFMRLSLQGLCAPLSAGCRPVPGTDRYYHTNPLYPSERLCRSHSQTGQ